MLLDSNTEIRVIQGLALDLSWRPWFVMHVLQHVQLWSYTQQHLPRQAAHVQD